MNEGKVECLECGKFFGFIAPQHLRNIHGMSTTEYKEKHPGAKFSGEAQLARKKYAMRKRKINTEKIEEDQITDDLDNVILDDLDRGIPEEKKIFELTDVVEETDIPKPLKINFMEIGNEIRKESSILSQLEKSPVVNNKKLPKLEELEVYFTKKMDEFKKPDIHKLKDSNGLIPQSKLKILNYLNEIFPDHGVENNYFIIKPSIAGRHEYKYVTDITITDLMIDIEFPNSFWHNMDSPKPIRDENLSRDGWTIINIDSRMPTIEDVREHLLSRNLISIKS